MIMATDHERLMRAAVAGDWPMVRALLDEYSAAELYRLTDILAGIEHEAVEAARRPRV
jgi:hypothetical protein